MHLVRLGDKVYNLDLVKKVDLTEDKVTLYFVGDREWGGEKKPDIVMYKDASAKLLFDYIMENSTYLGESTPAPTAVGSTAMLPAKKSLSSGANRYKLK